MSKKRRQFSPDFKFRVALKAAKGQQTIGELAAKYGVHPNQISQWKRQLLESGADMFNHNGSKVQRDRDDANSEGTQDLQPEPRMRGNNCDHK